MIEQARELGLALANSPEFLRMAKARQNMTENTALCELMTAFNDKRDAVVALMRSDTSIASKRLKCPRIWNVSSSSCLKTRYLQRSWSPNGSSRNY